jgi:hypothetical protein
MSAAKKLAVTEQMPLQAVQRVENPLLGMLGQLATSPSFNAEAFRMIVDLIREEKAGQAKADFNAAFAAMQAELPTAPKGGRGHNNKAYARYEDIDKVAKPVLGKHGLSINHTIHQDDNKVKIRAVLRHMGGHEESAEIILPLDTSGNKNPVQAYGSTTAYGKRYTYAALIGISAEETDDDAKAAGAGDVIASEQVTELRKLLTETDTDEASFCEIGGVESLEQISTANFPKAVQLLKQKKAAMAKAAQK